jgi:hypothetical protein
VPGVPLTITSAGGRVRIEPEACGGRVVGVEGELVVVSSSGRPVTDGGIREALDAGRR